MVAAQALCCALTLALSLGRGVGGSTRIELLLLGVAALGVAAWWQADDPTLATCAVIAADLVGVALMLPKTFRNPDSETASTFVIGVCAAFLGLLATGLDRPSLMLYPIFLVVADSALVGLILLRRERWSRPRAPEHASG